MAQTAQSGFTLAKQIALYQQHLDKAFCDIVITIQNEDFFVHSCIVAAACPKLHKIIEENKVAVDQKHHPGFQVELKQDVLTTDVFEFMLSYIYLGALDWDKVTPDLVNNVLKAAEWCEFHQLAEDYMSMNRTLDREDENRSPANSTIIMVDTFDEDSEENENPEAMDMGDAVNCCSTASQDQQQELFCVFCGEQFDSAGGEALIEHMKIHQDEQAELEVIRTRRGTSRRKASLNVRQKYKSLIPNSRESDDDHYDANDKPTKKAACIPMFKKDYTCEYCDKKLPTLKSLNTHMKRQCQSRVSIKEEADEPMLIKDEPDEPMFNREEFSDRLVLELSQIEASAFPNKSTKGLNVCTGEFVRPYVKRRGRPVKSRNKIDLPTKKRVRVTKMWLCPICPEIVFEKKRFQLEHIRSVHGSIKRYVCEHCGKELDGKTALTLHTRIHTGERPYHCSVCGRGFSERKTMEDHTRRHTGERPFLCTVCGKDFTFRQSLYRHMKFHTGDRPHQCHVCGKAFVLKQNLQEHIVRHNKHKLIKCTRCEQQFANQEMLIKHQQEKHMELEAEETEENEVSEHQEVTVIDIAEDVETIDPSTEYEVTIEESILEHYDG